jgi:hypothetical protein
MNGLGVQALNGANRAELTRLADMALQFLERSSFDPGVRRKKFAQAKQALAWIFAPSTYLTFCE